MSKDDNYFQFPVTALQMNKLLGDVTDEELSVRCYDVISYSLISTGMKFREEDRIGLAQKHPEYKEDLEDWQVAVMAGAWKIGVSVTGATLVSRFEKFRRINTHPASTKFLRLRKELMFEFAELTNGMHWREFSILCGVLAGIGAHQHARLSYDYITVLAAGYSSIAQAKKAKAKLADRHVIRYTVHKLVERGLFAMVALNKRHNVYSVALNMSALADQLVARASKQIQRDTTTASMSVQARIAELKEQEARKQKILQDLGKIG